MYSSRSGFTIVEMLLVMAIIASIGALSFPFIVAFSNRNNLDIAVNTLVQAERRAQTMSTVVESDSQWGVNIASGRITLYKGTTYAGRDTGFDENHEISSSISVTGLTDISYSKVFGTPTATGTTTLTNENDTRMVTVNAKGTISY